MTASLREKNGIFHMIFSFYDENGNRQQKSGSTHLKVRGNKRAAEAMMKARLKELEMKSSGNLQTQDVMFLPAMEEWLNEIMPTQVRANTLSEYKRAFNYHLKTYKQFIGLPLQSLTPKILQTYYNSKVKEGLSPNTIHKQHTNINKFLKYALQLDMIDRNPADWVTLPKKVKSAVASFYNAEQLQSLLSLFWGDPIESAVFLTVHLGLRRSEVCGLRWDSIDFNTSQITICHTAVVTNGQVIYADNTKSSSSHRVLSMSQAVANYLKRVKKAQEADKLLFGKAYDDSGYVCTKRDGTPINPDFVTHHFQRVIDKSDLPHIRFHDLRHSTASLLHQSGYDLKDIQTWLGHSDVQTTGNIYTHLDAHRMDHMAQALDNALKPQLKAV